jgi:hypothetical protein
VGTNVSDEIPRRWRKYFSETVAKEPTASTQKIEASSSETLVRKKRRILPSTMKIEARNFSETLIRNIASSAQKWRQDIPSKGWYKTY